MSNSKLVVYTKLSPNYNERSGEISKITIHHMAGNLSVERCGDIFASAARKASSNYGIGSDGRVALYVEEKNRAWTSSSPDNDYKAVTIEVANDGSGPDWHVSDKALAALIELCVDICERNHIEKLTYTGDATGNLTRHNMFAKTTCPGPYLQSKFPYIAEQVNKRLKKSIATTDKEIVVGSKSIETIAKEVIKGMWGNGQERKDNLAAAGYNYEEVQAAVNARLTGKPQTVNKSVETVVKEVIAGKWGNGQERKDKLAAAGYDYKVIQKKVNEVMANA